MRLSKEQFKSIINKKSTNKKVRNAVKSEVEGVKFDSNLERDFYFELIRLNIKFEFKHKFLLVEGFKYDNETIRPISWIPDYYFEDLHLIIDTKGYSTDKATIKIKLFKNMIYRENFCKLDANKHITVLIVKNKKDFTPAILSIRARQRGLISVCEDALKI